MRYTDLVLTALLLVLLTSCLKPTYFRRMNSNCIPEDIRNPKYTLLVEGWSTGGFAKANTKTIVNTMDKNYPDKHEVVLPKDTSAVKYSDRSKYRYYILFSRNYVVRTSGLGAIKSGTYGTNAYGVIVVYDRLTGENLGNTREELQSYKKLLKFFSEYVRKNR